MHYRSASEQAHGNSCSTCAAYASCRLALADRVSLTSPTSRSRSTVRATTTTMTTALVAGKCVLLSLSAGLLLSLVGGASAMLSSGLPPPQPMVNFTIGVQGVVWCKSCRYPGYFAPMDASPLPGAKVYLRCKHGRRAVTVPGQSGPGGYFLIQTSQQVSAFTSQQCRVYVPRSPVPACGVPVYPPGRKGLQLKFQEFVKRDNGLQGVYSVGNRFFGPKYPGKCY